MRVNFLRGEFGIYATFRSLFIKKKSWRWNDPKKSAILPLGIFLFLFFTPFTVRYKKYDIVLVLSFMDAAIPIM